MIELNVTVFIQAFHFIIAWWMLSRFFFTPLVAIVQKERAYKKKLEKIVNEEQASLASILKKQNSFWGNCKLKFSKIIPNITNERLSFTLTSKEKSKNILTASEEKKIVQDLSQFIVERVTHD